MNRAPNDGLHWLHLLRFEDEADLGIEVVRDGRFFVVRYVREYGAAWRAGIRVGERVSGYRFNIHSNEKIVWTEDALAILNAIPASTAIGIQVRISAEPILPQTTRNGYIKKKKYLRKQLDSGMVVRRNATPYNFDRLLEDWDRSHFHAPQGGAPAEGDAPAEAQGGAPAEDDVDMAFSPDDQDDVYTQSPSYSPAQSPSDSPAQFPPSASAQLSPAASPSASAQSQSAVSPSASAQLSSKAPARFNTRSSAKVPAQSSAKVPAQFLVKVPVRFSSRISARPSFRALAPPKAPAQPPSGSLAQSPTDAPVQGERPAATITFMQAGGPKKTTEASSGWMDILESEESGLPDKLISFMCQRLAQLVTYDRLRVVGTDYFTNVIQEMKYEEWIKPTLDVVCIPICVDSLWSLVAVITEPSNTSETTVLQFDSINTVDVAETQREQICEFLRKAGVKNPVAISVSVPAQENDNDSGLHVLSHFEKIVGAMDRAKEKKDKKDKKLFEYIQNAPYKKILTRADLRKELEDGFTEALYHIAYWGMYERTDETDQDVTNTFWWPCCRISSRLAAKSNPKSQTSEFLPIIWFKKSPNDPLWIHPDDLKPISELKLDWVLANCKFTPEEEKEVSESYNQAMA